MSDGPRTNLSTTWLDDAYPALDQLWAEIESRFGICPSFFKVAHHTPAIAWHLFRMAEFTYLDNPMPAHFKERLFTWLSRFCEVRYCVSRHCAFLLGRGHVAGDASAPPLDVEQALALLKELMPAKEELPEYLSALEKTEAPLDDWPDFDSNLGRRFRVACAVVFLDPGHAGAWLHAMRELLGARRYEQLMLFLAFVRTAHFWTQVHPELAFEPDLETLLREHEALVKPLLGGGSEFRRWELGQRLYDELQSLRESRTMVEALRKNEERFRATFENAAVGITHVAPDGHWLEVNQRFCDIVGYSREELMTKTFGDITHPGDLEADWKLARRLLAGEIENYAMEKRCYHKDGSIIWINQTVSLMRKPDGSPDYRISIVEDISARKHAEEKLREREERLLLASRAAGLGIFEWDLQADSAVWENERMYELFGHTRGDGTLSKVQLLERYVDPDDAAALDQTLTCGMKSGRSFHTVYRIRRKDGALRWVDLCGDFEFAHNGKPLRMIGVLADITERQKAEEKLRESEERFRILADTAPVLIWTSGVDKLCTFFNKPWLDFTGRTMEQELGNGWTAGVHTEDYAGCLETYVTSFEVREPFKMEYRLRRYDGEYRWIVDNGVPRFSPNGDFLGYVGSCIDITERKEIEQALRASELRFRTMVSAIPSLTYEGDSDGNNNFVSDQWLTYTGMTPEENAGRGFARAFHPDDAENNRRRYFDAVKSGTPFEARLRVRAADGSYRWFLNRALPARDAEGRIVRWAGSLTDIEDLVRVEQELRESKERLAGIVSTAMDAIITVDENQRVVLFNEAAEKIFGCPAAEAMGQTLDRFIPELFRGATQEPVRGFSDASTTSSAVGHLNAFTALRADGTEFPIEAAISSIEVGGRKLFTIIHRDITERKRAEAGREQLAQEQVARAAAEAATRSKDEFLTIVSHELRSPLNAILGYTRMLHSGPVDRDLINKVTSVVERNAKAQLQIIEDLLDSARIISGKLRIEPGPVDLVPVLESALDTARSAAEAKGVTLVTDFGPRVEISGDTTRLQQVMWNLLANAVKFTPKGGRVEVRMESDADNVRIRVSDTGKGMESEFLPFVFDRYRQADMSSVRRHGGLGLGLSLVKYLVELHGGTITAASEGAGRGATFTVELPRGRH